MVCHLAEVSWPVFVTILYRGTPRAGNPAPDTYHHACRCALDELDEGVDIFFLCHVIILSYTNQVTPFIVFVRFTEFAVLISAELDQQSVDAGPRPGLGEGRDS